jgi:rhamnogalacturonyl hydrolase YesR
VYVALAEHLSIMDKENPAYKTYLYDFKMMSASLAERQREDGFWNVNLSDSIVGNGKETTGTSGFLYGLSVGIKLGLLNKKTYLPIAQKAYEGLTEYALQENGLVGYCQPIGTDPSDYSEALSERSTNSFGVGLYLLGVTAYSDIV